MTSLAVTGEVMEQPAVLFPCEEAYVAETATGLRFRPDTPITVWGPLLERLLRQRKVLEWAIADAINFGEAAYGEMYSQWVEETGLAKRTLQNIASIGRKIEPSRRREHVSFAHHAEVAYLPVSDQESLLDAAEGQGMTRYELRDAARERRRELDGAAQTAEGDPLADAPLPLSAADLTDEARQAMVYRMAGVGKRHAIGFERGFVAALIWADQDDAFTREMPS